MFNTFAYRGAGVWNHLDLEVKQASSFKAFKDAVKNDLFCCFFFYSFNYVCTIVRIGF